MLCLCLEWRSRRILERSDQSQGDFSETAPRFIKGEFASESDDEWSGQGGGYCGRGMFLLTCRKCRYILNSGDFS